MEISAAVKTLSALAQEIRLAAFRMLIKAGPAGLPAGHIAEALEIPSPTLSFHLKELTHAGLVESRRDGRQIIYSLKVESLKEFLTFLTEDCCSGHPDLCQPQSNCCDEENN